MPTRPGLLQSICAHTRTHLHTHARTQGRKNLRNFLFDLTFVLLDLGTVDLIRRREVVAADTIESKSESSERKKNMFTHIFLVCKLSRYGFGLILLLQNIFCNKFIYIWTLSSASFRAEEFVSVAPHFFSFWGQLNLNCSLSKSRSSLLPMTIIVWRPLSRPRRTR